jgi:hypothetical protein
VSDGLVESGGGDIVLDSSLTITSAQRGACTAIEHVRQPRTGARNGDVPRCAMQRGSLVTTPAGHPGSRRRRGSGAHVVVSRGGAGTVAGSRERERIANFDGAAVRGREHASCDDIIDAPGQLRLDTRRRCGGNRSVGTDNEDRVRGTLRVRRHREHTLVACDDVGLCVLPDSRAEHEPAHDDSVTDRSANERHKLRALRERTEELCKSCPTPSSDRIRHNIVR